MVLQAICPRNVAHDTFTTVVYVSEEWVVNAYGEFVAVADTTPGEVLHKPDRDNLWTCTICSAEAVHATVT